MYFQPKPEGQPSPSLGLKLAKGPLPLEAALEEEELWGGVGWGGVGCQGKCLWSCAHPQWLCDFSFAHL